MCLVYVDDTIITGPDEIGIDLQIKSLGIAEEEQVYKFVLNDEREVGATFLGIYIRWTVNTCFHLTQTGLINKVLATAGMENHKATVRTPTSTTPLGIDPCGNVFEESWE